MNGEVQGRNALVLYGTETGNAQEFAEELACVAERLHFSTTVAELDALPINQLNSYQITIIAISTAGQGEFPSNAKVFWASLLRKRLSPAFLEHVQFFLVGLGDTSYPKFNWAARKLGKRMQQLGAREVIESCEADEQDEESTDGAFLAWLPLFKAALLENFPLQDGSKPIPDHEPLPSKWVLQPIAASSNGETPDWSFQTQKPGNVEETRVIHAELSVGHSDSDSRPIPDSFQAVLRDNKRMTPSAHWQDVRLLSLETDKQIDYLPGDTLSILPKNFPKDVDTLIQLMNWTFIADTPITFTATSQSLDLANGPPCPIPYLFASPSLTLRSLLTNYLDITAIPRRSLFARLALYTDDSFHHDRLVEFTLPQYLDEYYDYATRSRRSILEILQEFDSIKIPWYEAANIFPVLRGRRFSIASGSSLTKRNEEEGSRTTGTKFELVIAIVKYRTVIKKIRQGVCTRYLAALAPGSTLNVIHRTDGRFFPSSSKSKGRKIDVGTREISAAPKVLIGAGTGIAPLRALVLSDDERISNGGARAPIALFFGARNASQDFFFEEEWIARHAAAQVEEAPSSPPSSSPSTSPSSSSSNTSSQGQEPRAFELITAFSRDQPHKIYVQDRLREHAELVFEMIWRRGAVVVVCGSAGAMPRLVRQALVEVLIEQGNREEGGRGGGGEGGAGGGMSEEGGAGDIGGDEEEGWTPERAGRYLDGMEKARRYMEEAW